MHSMEKSEVKVALVIMASGLGKRFGGNKLMERLKDKPLVRWIMDAAEGVFDQVIVVTRSCQVSELCANIGFQYIHHDLPYRSDTARLGVSALNADIDYCFFVPGDQPLLKKETLIRLIEGAKQNSNRILRAGYGETVGSPVGFPKSLFKELADLPEGKGGNWVVKKHPELVQIISVEDASELLDIDTTEDFVLIKNRLEQMEGQSV